MRAKKCHVVIINWNGANDTSECLTSLLQHESNIDVTLIDNSEDHLSCTALEGRFPSVQFVYNDANVGFAKGCNQGFERYDVADSSYTLFLNNDTVITSPFIDEITTWMTCNQNVAAVSPIINYYASPNEPWFSGSVIDENTMAIVHCNFSIPKEPTVVPWLTGCALIVNNDHFRYVGGFDESFFLYSEDVDLSFKLVNSGYSLVIYPLMAVLHKVSQSSNQVSQISTYYAMRNKIWILRRYFPSRVRFGVMQTIKSSIVRIVKSDITNLQKVKLLTAVLTACVSGLLVKRSVS